MGKLRWRSSLGISFLATAPRSVSLRLRKIMAINIGATSQATLSLASVGASRSVRGVASNVSDEKPGQLVREKEAPAVRAGFGEIYETSEGGGVHGGDTTSPPPAAHQRERPASRGKGAGLRGLQRGPPH